MGHYCGACAYRELQQARPSLSPSVSLSQALCSPQILVSIIISPLLSLHSRWAEESSVIFTTSKSKQPLTVMVVQTKIKLKHDHATIQKARGPFFPHQSRTHSPAPFQWAEILPWGHFPTKKWFFSVGALQEEQYMKAQVWVSMYTSFLLNNIEFPWTQCSQAFSGFWCFPGQQRLWYRVYRTLHKMICFCDVFSLSLWAGQGFSQLNPCLTLVSINKTPDCSWPILVLRSDAKQWSVLELPVWLRTTNMTWNWTD